MKTLLLRCLLLLTLALASGCAVGQKIDLTHAPEAVTKVENPSTVSVNIQDQRPYVISGSKEQCFIGIYRAGFGNPWDVRTKDNAPLASIVKKDLVQSLQEAGFTVQQQGAERNLSVAILEYNFDCFINCRAWHRFIITVSDAHGTVLKTSEILEENIIQGNAFIGPKGAMESRLPQIYGDIIARMVVRNKDILSALTAR